MERHLVEIDPALNGAGQRDGMGGVADGVEEVVAGPGNLTDLPDRTGQLRLDRDETRLAKQSQMVFDQLSLLAWHFACTIFAQYLGDLRSHQFERPPTVLDLQQ